MSRAVLILNNDWNRKKAVAWVSKAPPDTRVEFKEPKRTLPQNDHMWALLTDVAQQAVHHGRKYTTDQWKVIFLHALGREVQFLPALDGSDFVPYGQSSSDLSKDEMSNLIDFIYAWGAEHELVFESGALSSQTPVTAPALPDTSPREAGGRLGGGSSHSESPPFSEENSR